MAERVCRAVIKARSGGHSAKENLHRHEETPWLERKEAEIAGAYHIDDPQLHKILGEYMEARSKRKQLEAEDKEMKAKMDAIAYSLASRTDKDAGIGELTASDTVYQVAHMPSQAGPAKITAAIIKQFAPEYTQTAISVNTAPGGKVTVNVL